MTTFWQKKLPPALYRWHFYYRFPYEKKEPYGYNKSNSNMSWRMNLKLKEQKKL